jgi:predicted transcriptional regulator
MAGATTGGWTFLTNHSHVMLSLAAEPELRIRDLAQRVGITERAVQRIVGELAAAGVLRVSRVGRRNHYAVDATKPLRHPVEAHCTVGDLIRLVTDRV